MRELNARTQALNAEGLQFNQQISQFHKKVDSYRQRCAGEKVGIPDMQTVKKVRAKQGLGE